MEWCRMSKDKLEARTKQDLEEMARKKGIAGWHEMRKDELIAALVKVSTRTKTRSSKKSPSRSRPQVAAAHYTNGSISAEEQVESSKYDVGVPTKDLSAKAPKD